MMNSTFRLSEGIITLPQGYHAQTLNTLTDQHELLPTFTISRDTLGSHNNVIDYIDHQLSTLQKRYRRWQQSLHELAVLGDNLTSGITVTFNFTQDDKIALYQKQAFFTLNMEDLLIFSLSKASPLTADDVQRFSDTLKSFQLHA